MRSLFLIGFIVKPLKEPNVGTLLNKNSCSITTPQNFLTSQELLLTCNVSSSLKESQDVQESFKHLESWYDDNVSMVDCLSDGPFWNFTELSCRMLTRNASTVLLFSSLSIFFLHNIMYNQENRLQELIL